MSARRRYLVTTLALLAIVALYVAIEASGDRPAPRLARTAAPVTRPARTPVAREILARGAELALTDDQGAQLEALDRAWRAEGAALRASTDEAGEEFLAFARGQAARGASLAEVERQSARYRELSAEVRANRGRHAAAAMAILNDTQRGRLAPVAAPQTSGGRE
jgi:hypothetical protein